MTDVQHRSSVVKTMTEEGASLQDISKVLGVDRRVVSRYRNRLNLAAEPRVALTEDIKDRIAVLRAEGMPSNWVAEDVGCAPRTVSTHVRLSEEAAKEWKSAWLTIRKNPDLLALHREFTPPPVKQWAAARG